ncbi:MAG TPA: hypothetical protein VGK39_02090, partial [Cyclobacteriaceae bacterium]
MIHVSKGWISTFWSKKNMKYWSFWGGLIFLIASSCMQQPEEVDLVKHMVVQTEYDTKAIDEDQVFTSFNTFVLVQDTMGFVSTV